MHFSSGNPPQLCLLIMFCWFSSCIFKQKIIFRWNFHLTLHFYQNLSLRISPQPFCNTSQRSQDSVPKLFSPASPTPGQWGLDLVIELTRPSQRVLLQLSSYTSILQTNWGWLIYCLTGNSVGRPMGKVGDFQKHNKMLNGEHMFRILCN